MFKKLVGVLIIASLTLSLLGIGAFGGQKVEWKDRKVEITVSPMYNWFLDKTLLELMSTDLMSLNWTELYYVLSTQLFLTTHPNIRINFRASQDGWGGGSWAGISNKEKLMTAFASGEAPATYMLNVLGDPQSLIYEGYAADITEFVNQWDMKDFLVKNRWGLWSPVWKDGRCYGIPHYGYTGTVVGYRKDWFQEAGIFDSQGEPGPSVDWRISDFLAICQKVANPKKQRWAISISGSQDFAEQIFQSFGIPLLIPDPTGEYTWKSTLNIPEAQPIFDFYKELVWNQKSVLTSTGAAPLGPGMDFVGGKLAMVFTSTGSFCWRAGHSTDYLSGPSFYHVAGTPEEMPMYKSCGIVPFPKGPEGVRINSTRATYWAVNPTLTKEQQKAAWEWLSWEIPNNAPRNFIGISAVLTYLQKDHVAAGNPQTYPAPPYVPFYFPKDIIPKWAERMDILDNDPAEPKPSAYGLMVLGIENQLTPFIETIISDPKANIEKEAEAAANRINNGVLDYRVEGQSIESYKKYYTDLATFYKENFPEYYEGTFKKLFEKYYKVW